MIDRLKMEDIFKPGYKPRVEYIDFDDPKNIQIKRAFEETKKRQEELLSLNKLDDDWNLTITI